jgi:hypothetical protein
MNIPHLKVTLSKTRDDQHDYLQIVSDDQFALNIVLIADKIDVDDRREPPKQKRHPARPQ